MVAVFAVPARAAAPSSIAWSQFRDNPQGTSQANVVGAQSSRGVPGFPVNLPGEAADAPGGVAVSAGGTAIVGQGPALSAWSASGKRLWTYNAPGGGAQITSLTAPALSASGSTVYSLQVEVNIFTSPSSSLIAVNAITGQLRWSAPVGTLATGLGIAQPTVTVGPDGSLYVAANIPGAPGAGPADSPGPITSATVSSFTPYGGVNWSTVVPGPVAGGPVLDTSGNVYVSDSGGSGAGGGQVIALSSSGAVLWQTPLGDFFSAGYLGTAPLVSPGGTTVYVGTRGSSGAIYALATSDGAILGTIGSGGISGTPALSSRSGYLFAGSTSALLNAFPSGGGAAVWQSETAAPESVNAPAIGADGTVYATGPSTILAAVGTTGITKWVMDLPNGLQLSSPAIGPTGNVYFTTTGQGSGANQLYAFQGP